jgi:hypothetical protein
LKPDTTSAFAHHAVDTKRAKSNDASDALALGPLLAKIASERQGNLVDRVLDRIADGKREYWLNADNAVLVLTEQGARELDGTGTHIAIVTEAGFKVVPVPISFGQYDDDRIVGISDADADGNIEVWIVATTGECDGEAGTQRPGIDCAVQSYHRLEQFGDSFIPYVEGPRPKLPKGAYSEAGAGSASGVTGS